MRRLFSAFSIFILTLTACQPKMKTPEGDFTIHAEVEGTDTIIFEKIEADNPYFVPLHIVMTSFSDLNGAMVTTGPKTSS